MVMFIRLFYKTDIHVTIFMITNNQFWSILTPLSHQPFKASGFHRIKVSAHKQRFPDGCLSSRDPSGRSKYLITYRLFLTIFFVFVKKIWTKLEHDKDKWENWNCWNENGMGTIWFAITVDPSAFWITWNRVKTPIRYGPYYMYYDMTQSLLKWPI